uniref:Uncharacterized protein n=1 Tax=Noccaea caerulescens TaxID=107243 RepID=A0A1J3H530_NOCCA
MYNSETKNKKESKENSREGAHLKAESSARRASSSLSPLMKSIKPSPGKELFIALPVDSSAGAVIASMLNHKPNQVRENRGERERERKMKRIWVEFDRNKNGMCL